MDEGLIATMIPTHNSLAYLKLCIESFRKYSLPENKLLVHVDGSNDGTCEWLDSHHIEYSHDEWKSISYALNTMVKRADSKFIGCMNDDVVFSPNWDKNVLSWLKSDVIICPHLVEPRQHDFGRTPEEFNEEAFINFVAETTVHELKPLNWGMWFMERDLFLKNGFLDENLAPFGMEDIDMYMRLMKNFPHVRVYEALDFMVYHFIGGSKSKAADWQVIGPRIDGYFAEKWGMQVGEATKKLREWVGY